MMARQWRPAEPEPKVRDALAGNLPKRCWVNQPSTLHRLHCYHGARVLAVHDYDAIARVYFVSGNVVSIQMPWAALSLGWPPERCR